MKNNKTVQPKPYDNNTTIKGYQQAVEHDIEKLDLSQLDTEELLEGTHVLVKEFVLTKQQILSDERKMQAIGSALISQKHQLDDIRIAQNQHKKSTESGLQDISQKQNQVSKEVSTILNTTKDVEALQEEQTELIETLSEFQEQYSQMTYQTRVESEESIDKLTDINSVIDLLSNEIGDMNLQERVAGLTDGINTINETLLDMKLEQTKATESNRESMDELVRQVVSFRKEVSDKELVQKLYYIQQSADTSDQKIMDLNFKIDMLIEKYELSKDEEDIRLEDLFDEGYNHVVEVDKEKVLDSVDDPVEQVIETEEITADEQPHKTEDDHVDYVEFSFGKGTSEEKPNNLNDKEIVDKIKKKETTTPKSENIDLSRKETQKKKGFLDKLFGGN